MKKTSSVIVGLIILLMLPVVSFSATPGPYLNAQFGVAIPMDIDVSDSSGTGTIKMKPGYATGIAVGYNFGMLRIEEEVGYQMNDMDKFSGCSGGICVSGIPASGDASGLSLLTNAYVDFANSSPVTPFFTAGIGVAKIYVNDFVVAGFRIGDGDDTVVAYQLGVGIAFAIDQHLTFDLKYRYFATADPNFEGVKATIKSQNIYCGFRYNF